MDALSKRIKVDLTRDEPLYLQVARAVERLAEAGGLAEGAQLPTVRELAAELDINFNTVSRAYRLLGESGLVTTRRGRGSYLRARDGRETEPGEAQTSLRTLAEGYLRGARRLGYPAEAARMAVEELIQETNRER